MKVTLKLFATLGKYLPAGALANEIDVEIGETTTPNELIDRFNVPRDMVHLVLLNGVYVDVEKRDQMTMSAGDALAIWPPIAGG